MREATADLHVHTTCSDGLHRPAEVVRMAAQAGLCWVAVTDHDTVDGLPEAQEEAAHLGIGLVPGMELSVSHRGRDFHVLAYWIDPADPDLRSLLGEIELSRAARIHGILDRLHALGVPLSRERVAALAGCSHAMGRPHVARALKEDGWVRTIPEAFARYLRNGGPAFVPKGSLDPSRALGVLRGAGGVAVLAHPGVFPLGEGWRDLLQGGIQGLETEHPAHRPGQVAGFRRLAGRHGLVATGGSDFHGRGFSEGPVGGKRVAERVVHELAARRGGREG